MTKTKMQTLVRASIVGLALIATDAMANERLILESLRSDGYTATNPAPATSRDLQKLLAAAQEWNGRCRDTEGANDPRVCEMRETIGGYLRLVGWCYGREDESGYEHKWHDCRPGSYGY